VKIFGRTVLAIAAALVVIFAAANRDPVRLNLWPLPFFAVMAALAAGVLMGGIAAWARGARWRRRAREAERDAKALRADRDALLAAQRSEAQAAGGVPRTPVPASRYRAGMDDE
jgi:uncharacterized integral membrane protein